MSSGLFVCMVLWEPFIGCFIGCFIGGRLLCGVCLTYSRQRPERSRMAIAEGCRLGGFLCPYAERTYGALRLPEITLSGFSRSVFRLFSIVCFARLYYVVGCFCVVSGCARSFRPIGRKRPKGAFPVIHALFSRLFRMPQIPVLSDPQPPERPQDEASDGGGQRQPTAGLSSPPAGSGGDDAAGRADDSRHNGRYVCRCAMFGHPVVAVACEGETKPGRGRCRFCGCLAGIAGRLGISEFSGRAGSGGVALPVSRSAGSGAGVSPALEAVADAAVVAASVVAAVGIADASGVFVIVSTVVFADCGGISPLSGSMRRMRWRIWRPSQRNSTTSPGCRA